VVHTHPGNIRHRQQQASDLHRLGRGGVPAGVWRAAPDPGGSSSSDLVMMKTNARQSRSASDGNEQLSQGSVTLRAHVQEDTVLEVHTIDAAWTAIHR
jgi:hypothetical protein